LPKTLKERKGRLMPGFPQLLEALAAEPGVRIGLATGNFSQSAGIKLRFYGIDGYFAGGGFGEDSLDRAVVVRAAIERVADGAAPDEIYVIGDTPHDITSALDNGVVGVGVATGSYGVEDLRASGARLVFADFSDWRRVAQVLLGRAAI
jgi:phosphoglycolate phosphatase-like HAD superfamily hydrolase